MPAMWLCPASIRRPISTILDIVDLTDWNAIIVYHIPTDMWQGRFLTAARQAATIAAGAGVGTLLLGHYSARYNDEQVLLQEAKAVFENSILTQEGMVFDVV